MKWFIVLLLSVSFVSCKKPLNTLSITFSRTEPSDSLFSIHNFSISNKDSIISRLKPLTHSVKHVMVISNLPDGNYYITYNDILGKTINKNITLENGANKKVRLITDSLQLKKFYNKIPLNNLPEGKSYTIYTSGGCVATMYGYYRVTKNKGDFYFESYNFPKKIIDKYEIDAVKKFEAELLAIENVYVCSSTDRMTYKIMFNTSIKTIVDNTCNWNGWGNMMDKLNKNRL